MKMYVDVSLVEVEQCCECCCKCGRAAGVVNVWLLQLLLLEIGCMGNLRVAWRMVLSVEWRSALCVWVAVVWAVGPVV